MMIVLQLVFLSCLACAAKLSILVKTVRLSREYPSVPEAYDLTRIAAIVAALEISPYVARQLVGYVKTSRRAFEISKAFRKSLRKTIEPLHWKWLIERYVDELTDLSVSFCTVMDSAECELSLTKLRTKLDGLRKQIRRIVSHDEGALCKLVKMVDRIEHMRSDVVSFVDSSRESLLRLCMEKLKGNEKLALQYSIQLMKESSFEQLRATLRHEHETDKLLIERAKNPRSTESTIRLIRGLERCGNVVSIFELEKVRASFIQVVATTSFRILREACKDIPMDVLYKLRDLKVSHESAQVSGDQVMALRKVFLELRRSAALYKSSPLLSRLPTLMSMSQEYRDTRIAGMEDVKRGANDFIKAAEGILSLA